MSQYISISSLLVCILIAGCIGCSSDSFLKEHQKLYNQVIEQIETGAIKTYQEEGIQIPEGAVKLPNSARLPDNLRDASVDGEVYIVRSNTGQLLVVFKTWRGKGFNMEGFLYVAKTLTSTEISKDSYGNSVITIGPVDLTLEKQLNPNWYKVSYQLD